MSKSTSIHYENGKSIVTQRKNSFRKFDEEYEGIERLNKIFFRICATLVITGFILGFVLFCVQIYIGYKTVDYINTNGLESLVERIWEGSTAR